MSNKVLEVKYKCMHPSCIVNCRDGILELDAGYYEELAARSSVDGQFKSPRGLCRMGFAQDLEALEVADAADGIKDRGASLVDPSEDPVAVLIQEHKEVLERLEVLKEHLRVRDLDLLWVSTAELAESLNLHSIEKEEGILLPVMKDLLPLGEGLVSIVKEDHRELMSLLLVFRDALVDDEILDGIAHSMVTNLESHIRKEDTEFFTLVNKCIDDEVRKTVIAGFKEVEARHVKITPGNRDEEGLYSVADAERRRELHENILAVKDLVNIDNSGCCH
jgi:hemerythrin-like domain-containing protein